MVVGLGSITLIHLVENHQVYIRSISETWNDIQNAPAELKEVGRKTEALCVAVESLLQQLHDGNTILSGRVCEESAGIEKFLRACVKSLVVLMDMQESQAIKLPNGKRAWTDWFQQSDNLNSVSWTKEDGHAGRFMTRLTRDVGFVESIALAVKIGNLNALRSSLVDIDSATNPSGRRAIPQSCQRGIVPSANPVNIAGGLPEELGPNVGILEPPPSYSARPNQDHTRPVERASTSTMFRYSDSRDESPRTIKVSNESMIKCPSSFSKKVDSLLSSEIHGAAEKSKVQELKALLRNGDRNINDKKRGWTALGLAARAGSVEAVGVLLSWGATINLQMDRGLGLASGGGTALHWAADRGHLEVVALLLEKGADIEAMNKGSLFGDDSGTPLMLAAKSGKVEIASLLLNRGANIMATDVQGNTSLYRAVAGNQPGTASMLIAEGADVSHGNRDGDTALHSAAGYGRLGLLNMLIKAGAEVNKKNRWGQGAIHRAAEESQRKAMGILRDSGACQ
ncbi:ankyrin repeat-containing domain protein [Amylocarpus encephaloides]|uniref:Ankyrin repeat-containing domain protein n=1 Tax=Amylocarpus encephaloides TaxID=45428 RepID=A0A9P7YDZ7_9HELO|nr:ankyrin repeat-containing domain protein [Amylocarpus encephaloides]